MSPVSWSASYLLREPLGISTTTSISMVRSVASAASGATQGAGASMCQSVRFAPVLGGYSHIVRVVAGALLVLLIGAALLVGLRPVTPARTFDDYEHKAKDTAE